ncbi:MAG: MFS transporter [Burkholderiaceae bacterium]
MTSPVACDADVASNTSGDGVALHPTAIVFTSVLGSGLAFIDGSVVNVALPTIGADLHAGPAALSWTINAYLLPLGALILFGGAAGDHYGRRRLFVGGIAVFLFASILCSFAPSLPWLLAGRALQGLAAALLMPNSLAILGSTFDGEARGRAIGTWAAAGAIFGAVGPVVGGWIVDLFGWRPIFLINMPIGVAAIWLALTYTAESRDGGSGSLDWGGGAAATLGLGMLVWALTAAAEPSTPRIALALAAGVGLVLLALFLGIEARRGDDALMPFGLFGTSTFAGLSLLTLLLYAALAGLLVLLPYVLIRVGRYSATEAGAAMLPVPLLIGGVSRLMGRVAARVGGRVLLVTGSAIVAAGLALYARIGDGAIDYWRDILPPTMAVAVGMALCVAPLTTSVIASVDRDHVGAASGFNSALARIGGLITTALLGFVFAAGDSPGAFMARVRVAALIGAGCAAVAALCALALIRNDPKR